MGDRKTKDALSKKYKVSGIPSFVIVDAKTGELITDDGRTAITEDPEGDGFPWKPKSLDDVMGAVTTLQNGKGAASTVDKTTALAGKTVGLYFSAHWCGPCRGFTPELIKTYNAMKAAATTTLRLFSSRPIKMTMRLKATTKKCRGSRSHSKTVPPKRLEQSMQGVRNPNVGDPWSG